MTEDAGREVARCQACGQLSGEHVTRHVALLVKIQEWVKEYGVDGPTCVYEMGVASAELAWKLHHELHERLAIWEKTAAQIMSHTRRN
jgi:hypothetical protein